MFHPADGVYAGADEPYLFGGSGSAVRIPSTAAIARSPVQRSGRQRLAVPGGHQRGCPDAWMPTRPSPRRPSSRARSARAAAAHGEHEKRNGGQRDENWPDLYAEYMVREQSGKELPL